MRASTIVSPVVGVLASVCVFGCASSPTDTEVRRAMVRAAEPVATPAERPDVWARLDADLDAVFPGDQVERPVRLRLVDAFVVKAADEDLRHDKPKADPYDDSDLKGFQWPAPAREPRILKGDNHLQSIGRTLRRDLLQLPAELVADSGNVLLNPLAMGILIGGGLGSIATYNTVDERIVRYYGGNSDNYKNSPPAMVRDFADHVGFPHYHAAVALGCYFISIPVGDEKFYSFSKAMIYALGVTDLATGGLKLAVFDRAPNGIRFGFPSGHTSSAVAFASVVHQYYGPVWAAPFYGLSVYTAWGRLWDREHRFTDVWYGAVMGLVIGHVVAGRHRDRFMKMDPIAYVEPPNSSRDGATTWIGLQRRF